MLFTFGLPGLSSYCVEQDLLFAGQYPGAFDPASAKDRVAALVKHGIANFIDLTHPNDSLEPYCCHLPTGVSHRFYPIHDVSVPRHPGEMARILDAIDAALAHRIPTYVHCWGGRGRTGTVIGCWLVRHGMTGEAAVARVAELWSVTHKASFGTRSPETSEQIAYIRSWHEPAEYRAWNRSRGALLGLAVGDAVGAAVEFKSRGTFHEITDMIGGGPHNLIAGEWTDDTSMALCLAESLLTRAGFDARDQMERYVRWWREGYLSCKGNCFDIGNTVVGALRRFRAAGNPFAGTTDPSSAGNGSLMRLAPVPIVYRRNLTHCVSFSALSSETTHGAHASRDACKLFGAMLTRAIAGVEKEEVLLHTGDLPELSDLCAEIREVADGSFARKNADQIVGSGYVVRSLEAALWAVYHASNFRDAVLAATNLGDDADTTAAIAGQLAGALWGEDDIPQEWLERLVWRDKIEELANRLFDLVPAVERE